jgi:ABC-2 type transport system permease protein
VIWDREFGFLKEVLVAPASRKETISGRIVGDSIVATVQGAIILFLTLLITEVRIPGILPTLGVGLLLAVAFSSFGVCLATRIQSMEGFQMIMAVLMLPIIFLSGAIYPINAMPWWMKLLAYINPLTYAVDGARSMLTDVDGVFPLSTDLSILGFLALAFLGIAMFAFERSTLE